MGYTNSATQVMIGLGASSISDSWYGFAQNVKQLEEYQHLVENDIIPIYRGHLLSEEDQVIRRHILNLMCRFTTSWKDPAYQIAEIDTIMANLREMLADGLVVPGDRQLTVPENGRPFIRNICMAFDLRLHRKTPEKKLFSMTI
jgi:oxygen-independent coproporphyrinogen-3 oxidase